MWLYDPPERPFSTDNSLIFDGVFSRSERSTFSPGYDFSSRSDVINQSVRDQVTSVDCAPRYESVRAPEATSEPVHLQVYKSKDNDGLPTYEEVVKMNH